jgi:hypothetical protein
LPAKSTPSTGGGPFNTRARVYRTKPSGFAAIIVAIAVGVFVVFDTNPPKQEHATTQITPITIPAGRVLVLNELSTPIDTETRKNASNKIAELSVAGWDVFIDSDAEASVRSWLPQSPTTTLVPEERLLNENIVGIILITEGAGGGDPLFYYIDQTTARLFP